MTSDVSRETREIREPTEEEFDAFQRLVRPAARVHELAWCVKRQWTRYTAGLMARECLRCPDFVLQGGVCDPL